MSYHSFLFFNIRRDEVMQKEEGIRVDGDKDVVLELGDETALDHRFLVCNI